MGDFTEMNFITIHEALKRILDGYIRFKKNRDVILFEIKNLGDNKVFTTANLHRTQAYRGRKLSNQENNSLEKKVSPSSCANWG